MIQQLKNIHELKRSSSTTNNKTNIINSNQKQGLSKSQKLIRSIIQFKDSHSTELISKFTLQYLITLLDKNKIESIDKVYKIKQQGFNLLEFIRFFLNAIEHSQIETLYLTMGLVDLFKTISEINNFAERIKFIHLTDFVCNNILQNNTNISDNSNNSGNITGNVNNTFTENKIEMKLIPTHKPISPDYQIKQYIINPPTIYGNRQETVYKLSLNNAKVDKNKHDSVVTSSFFSFQYKKIFSLDALSDGISIYDVNCRLQKKLRPQNSKIKKDVVVLSFAYSQRQERIGAVLKDFTLSFWDFIDNLQFQKIISTASCCQQYQTNIWYLEYFQAWITSDKTGTIYIWNLERQLPQRTILCEYKGKINDICQIPCLNILAIAQECRVNRLNPSKKQNDQAKIILYNYFRGEQVGQISTMADMRIPHTLQYSQTYQVLLSAGFEKKINIFEINHKYLDTNLKGQLLGHQNLITNFILIKKTPMVVSSDDKGKVKIWDIRNYKCIQTLDFRDKTIITRLLDMVQIGKLGVLGSRINYLQFDDRLQIMKKYQSKEKNLPLGVSYLYEFNKLLIVTRKDLRLYNMSTGAIQKVFCDYHNKDEQIVVFKYYQLMKKVIIGNQKGQIKLFNLGGVNGGNRNSQNALWDGKQIKQQKLQGFQNGLVTHIEYDQDNKLFLTCGQNGTINVQKLIKNTNAAQLQVNYDYDEEEFKSSPSKHNFQSVKQKGLTHKQLLTRSETKQKSTKPLNTQEWQIIRQMKGNFGNKDITTLAFSVYHGMIAVGSNCHQIYVWDYQYAKLLFHINLPDQIQPTAMTFINGFSILVIAAGNGELYLVRLLRTNEHQYQQKNCSSNSSNSNSSSGNVNISNISSNNNCNANGNNLSTANGNNLNNSSSPKIIGPQQILSFKDNRIITKTSENCLEISSQQDTNDYITQIMVDISLKGVQSKSQNLQFAKLYIAYNSGKIALINLVNFLKNYPILPHRKTLPTYNPERQLREQFSIQKQKDKCIRLDLKHINQNNIKLPFSYKFIKPHQGSINGMKVLQFDKHYLVTCGNDERIKLWEENQSLAKDNNTIKAYDNNQNQNTPIKYESQVKLLGDFNVNLPLPYLWNFQIKEQKKIKDKIMFSLKIIQSIFKKFGSDISTGQSKILKLENLFKAIDSQQQNKTEQNKLNFLTQPFNNAQKGSNSTKKPYLFHQQFSKKDLHYDEIKKFNFYEIGGPSLRELQFKKKLDDMQKEWHVGKIKQQQQKSYLLSKIQHKAQKNQQKQQIISFLQDRQYMKKRLKKQDQQQFPMVKRINDEFKKMQSKRLNQPKEKQVNFNISSNNGNFDINSNDIKLLMGSTNLNSKVNKITSCFTQNSNLLTANCKIPADAQDKQEYGCLLRRYHHSTNGSKGSLKTKNSKGFEQYYEKKIIQNDQFDMSNGKLKTNESFNQRNSNNAEFFSLNNSRINSQSSLHQNTSNLKKKQLSFQNILKDMNNRVLYSRQARNPTGVYKQNMQLKQQSKKFQFPTQRLRRTQRLAKTQHGHHFRGEGQSSKWA